MITTIINGVEIKPMGNGSVQIFSDRPNQVLIEDLAEIISALQLQTSKEVQTNLCSPQVLGNQPSAPCHKAGLGEARYLQKDL